MDARKAITVFLLLTIWSTIAESQELNTILMESTFRIHGPAKTDPKNKIFFGTAFVVARPIPTSPGRGYAVMVTAAHVLDGIAGDEAILLLREKQADNIFKAHPFRLKIRNEGKDLFVRHQDADVAAMYISVPEVANFSPVLVDFFANDDVIKKYEIHPGDELFCLGFPLYTSANDAGFPILRGGKIASYPLTPARSIKQFLFDFTVFKGNSGGPVYLVSSIRAYGGTRSIEPLQYIMGLITELGFSSVPEFRDKPLNIGVVVPSQFILETIELLPPSPSLR